MNPLQIIPVLPGKINGQDAHLVDARRLHEFLGSGQDFTDWIKNRIRKYGFEEGMDWLLHKTMEQLPHLGGVRTIQTLDYHLTLDMAKELAMVERTPRGREARRYFIDCERQMMALRSQGENEAIHPSIPHYPVAINLLNADITDVNRQAWADVAGENTARFHARREELLRLQRQIRLRTTHQAIRELIRPAWAR